MKLLYDAFGVGVESQHLTISQVALRAGLMFFGALVIVRIADKRFFAKKTAFDVILGLMLASMLARAINGSEQLGPTLCGGAVLALLHRLLGWLSCKYHVLNGWIKGHSETLVENGQVQRETLRKHHLGDDDLLEALRLHGVESLEQVKLARQERSGDISVIEK